jgi:hypothetical protein
MKQSNANEISLVCLVRPHLLALLSPEARQHVDRGIALRHPQNAVMSVVLIPSESKGRAGEKNVSGCNFTIQRETS